MAALEKNTGEDFLAYPHRTLASLWVITSGLLSATRLMPTKIQLLETQIESKTDGPFRFCAYSAW